MNHARFSFVDFSVFGAQALNIVSCHEHKSILFCAAEKSHIPQAFVFAWFINTRHKKWMQNLDSWNLLCICSKHFIKKKKKAFQCTSSQVSVIKAWLGGSHWAGSTAGWKWEVWWFSSCHIGRVYPIYRLRKSTVLFQLTHKSILCFMSDEIKIFKVVQ